jgi:acyl carrier protein
MSELENELKKLIVSSLALEDVDPMTLSSETPLFGEGLGLGSIDALELAMALAKNYGVQLQPDAPENREILKNIRSIAEHVAAHRKL